QALLARDTIAAWTGVVEAAYDGPPSLPAPLPYRSRGPTPDQLGERNEIAHRSAEAGDARRALSLFRKLLPDQARVLGPDDPDTRSTLEWIAWLEYRLSRRPPSRGSTLPGLARFSRGLGRLKRFLSRSFAR